MAGPKGAGSWTWWVKERAWKSEEELQSMSVRGRESERRETLLGEIWFWGVDIGNCQQWLAAWKELGVEWLVAWGLLSMRHLWGTTF